VLVVLPFAVSCGGSSATDARLNETQGHDTPGDAPPMPPPQCTDPLTFADPSLEVVVAATLGVEAPVSREQAARLTVLDFAGQRLGSFEGIECLVGLRELDVNTTNLSGLDVLPLERLQFLNAGNNIVSDLSALGRAPDLQVLQLNNGSITSVEPLRDLSSLVHLEIQGNAVSDIEPLSGLSSLRLLRLSDNFIASLDELATLAALESLFLNDNTVADLSPLAGLTALRELSLPGNNATRLEPLADLVLLETLNVNENQIEDASPLSRLDALQRLDIAYNQLNRLGPLLELDSLRTAVVSVNQIDCSAEQETLAALRARGVDLLSDCE
jgi:Leucine-rich repeat (LRR) protein